MDRRTFLIGGGLVAGSLVGGVALMVNKGEQPIAPTTGRSIAFEDDFESLDSIDLTGRGLRGKSWFTDLPYGWGSTSPSALSVADSVLTITGGTNNYSIGSMSPKTGAGRAFSHGYFEARMAFDPANGPKSDGFPAFWSAGQRQFRYVNQRRNMEVDFFEAMHPSGKAGRSFEDNFAGTVHEWQLVGGEEDVANYGDNTVQLRGTDWKAWHDYGCEWVPGRLRWYFDGQVVLEERYGPNMEPSPNSAGLKAGMFNALEADQTELVLILGTGSHYPLRVDRVRVWQ